jgi:hypothetical protein
MTALPGRICRFWKSVDLRIMFKTFGNGKLREQPKAWAPKDASASLLGDPDKQDVILTVRGSSANGSDDVSISCAANCIGIFRPRPEVGWQIVAVEPDQITVKVGALEIMIRADGSIVREAHDQKTYIEADGSFLHQSEFVEAIMSADGLSLSRKTPDGIAAITPDGVITRLR